MIKHDWTLEELTSLYQKPLLDLVFHAAEIHRTYHNSKEIQLCRLVSIKTGGCSEDCKYCAQSSRYQTPVEAEPMMSVEEVMERAKEAKKNGLTRVCLGAAWRQVRSSQQFENVLQMVKEISSMGLEVCCTLGMLNDEQAKKLKEAGLYAYNHNLDTSDRYYKKVITTRTYTDRLQTLAAVRNAKISVCCGGIIGMGEQVEDRIRLIQTLSSFTPHPESVPINKLIPIPGTPMADQAKVEVWDLIRTIATCRIALPTSMVRISAGREKMSHTEQALCFLAGGNSIFVGDKLLTAPNKDVASDQELLSILQLTPLKAFAKTAKPHTEISTVCNEEFLKAKLQRRQEIGNKRVLSITDPSLTDFSSNDYLGFARSQTLYQNIEKEVLLQSNQEEVLLGATGSRLLTGNRAYIELLEKEIAAFHKAEASLIYTSGYLANTGLLSCVADDQDCYILDKQVHASTWEGARLSGAKIALFEHNNLTQLEKQLQKAQNKYKKIFICIESLYSMQGSVAPLTAISYLAKQYRSHIIVDEAHATGVYGKKGEGLVVENGLEDEIFARIHTFGKALGVHGAAVVGSKMLKEFLINFSKPLLYTTALPLHNYAAIRCAYQQIPHAEKKRKHLFSLISYFQQFSKDLAIDITTTNTPIQPIPVTDNTTADQLCKKLQELKMDVRAIKSPTVRKGKECLRVCLHTFNTEQQIHKLLDNLSEKNALCKLV